MLRLMFRLTCVFLACATVFPALLTATAAPQDSDVRQLRMTFSGQVDSAARELREKLQADPELKGRRLRMGKFSGPNLPDSNFELAFELAFQEKLADLVDPQSEFVLSGSYDLLPGAAPENRNQQVIQFTLVVTNRQRRKLQEVVREINESADIARIAGSTVALPDDTKLANRNKAVADAADQPQFTLREGTRIQAIGNPDYAIELLRRPQGTGEPQAVIPQNRNGQAFVELSVADTFEIVLYSFTGNCDASADITIDGLSVLNEFNEDGVRYDGYLVPRMEDSTPGRHVIPGWLKSAKQAEANVFQFVLNELGKGAATARKSRSGRGVINVQIFEAVPAGDELPKRAFGEVGAGKPLDIRYELRQITRRETPVVNLSLRYTQE